MQIARGRMMMTAEKRWRRPRLMYQIMEQQVTTRLKVEMKTPKQKGPAMAPRRKLKVLRWRVRRALAMMRTVVKMAG